MNELQSLEKKIIIIELYMAPIMLVYAFFAARSSNKFNYYLMAVLLMVFCAALKNYMSKHLSPKNISLFFSIRLLDVMCISVFMLIEGYKAPFVLFYSLLILISAMAMNSSVGYEVFNMSLISYMMVFLFQYSGRHDMLKQLVIAIFYILMIAFTTFFSLRIVKFYETKRHELEETNEQLRKTVAEFYMLQQIDTAMSSILDPDQLLTTVNDVILGVIGPTYSSILLFDQNSQSLIIKASNVELEKQENYLKLDSQLLWLCLDKHDSILKNQDKNQDFILTDPDIRSFICVPLAIRGKRHGMIFIEHQRADALTEDHLRLLKIIADNLSISLENSWLYERMHKLAILDGLTQVHNRMYFQNAFEEELAKAKGNYPLSIVIGDIDHFKAINDAYGHIAGDKVLKSITSILKKHLRQNDIIARYGGEEFVIILPGVNMYQAHSIVERLRHLIENSTISEEGYNISVTISFGIASYPECGWTTRQLLRQADRALYKAKNEGRNRVCLAVSTGNEKNINPS